MPLSESELVMSTSLVTVAFCVMVPLLIAKLFMSISKIELTPLVLTNELLMNAERIT